MNIDKKINNVEITLSYYAFYPIVIPGLLKIGLGLIQTITALSASILLSFSALWGHQASEKLYIHSCEHIVHGLGNILAGSIEAVPAIGYISFIIRNLKVFFGSNCPSMNALTNEITMMYHPDFKIYPYKDISIYKYVKLSKKNLEDSY